jgi:glycosyltransferase involved in cell wall biosynthesis
MLSRYDLEQMAAEAEMAPGSAISLGYFPFSQLPRVLSSASILVQPGRPIDFNRLRLPSKMQAYLASGTPTITFAAGFAELLEDRVEVLKTYGDEPEELADRIAELLEDSELRATLAAGGPRAARRLFDPVANVETLLAHYRRCLEAGPASRALTASAP